MYPDRIASVNRVSRDRTWITPRLQAPGVWVGMEGAFLARACRGGKFLGRARIEEVSIKDWAVEIGVGRTAGFKPEPGCLMKAEPEE